MTLIIIILQIFCVQNNKLRPEQFSRPAADVCSEINESSDEGLHILENHSNQYLKLQQEKMKTAIRMHAGLGQK